MTNGLLNGDIPILKTLKTRHRKSVVEEMTKEAYKNNRLWFGSETSPYDPRYQTEDLGDNAMRASEYGIKNLKRIHLIYWNGRKKMAKVMLN
jgi:hypothetical protein